MDNSYAVAIIGGACSGSEIAAEMNALGMEVFVFEQNPLPYGKIEDGLPRWHEKQRIKEMAAVDEKLSRRGVHFIPRCKLGRDISVEELRKDWGFPLVVMATGAWMDRPLRMSGADKVSDDSLIYQNAFVYWFNHYHDADYDGPRYKVPPAPVVIGGGLASIDVAKICQFELVSQKLAERGLEVSTVEMEHKGIDRALEPHNLTYADLGISPARLFYRKRVEDMPLVPLGDNPSSEKLLRAEGTRQKLVRNAVRKFGFEVFPLHSPADLVIEDGSVRAVEFQLNERTPEGRFKASGETARIETDLVVSSIGSIPEPIDGVPMSGELFSWDSYHTGAVTGLDGVYCVGNAITGRGNIKDSAKNARRLGVTIGNVLDDVALDYEKWFKAQVEEARAHVQIFKEYLDGMPLPSEADLENIHNRRRQFQERVGYGDYSSWREQILSTR